MKSSRALSMLAAIVAVFASGLIASPAKATSTPAPVYQIASGYYHTCAIYNHGQVECWGSNNAGQLGHDSNSPSNIPVAVSGIANARKIAVGGLATCVVTALKTVMCWGANSSGQLGDGTRNSSIAPVQVKNLMNARDVALGAYFACAIAFQGKVFCWGNGSEGEMGNGTYGFLNQIPVQVQGITDARSISAGNSFVCALLRSGNVKCWGGSHSGDDEYLLGNGDTLNSSTPTEVTGLKNVRNLVGKWNHTCGTIGPETYCWGVLNQQQIPTTTPIQSAYGLRSIASGWEHICGSPKTGGVSCFGNNSRGALGDGTNVNPVGSVNVVGITGNVRSIAAGADFTCALLTQTDLRCWGDNYEGQLGNGESGMNSHSYTPVSVLLVSND